VKFYDAGIDWVFAHKRLILIGAALSIPLCVLMFRVIGKERMPEIDQNELMVNVEWNENIHIDENHRRVNALLRCTDSLVTEHTAYVGMQDYILGTEKDLSAGEAELYFKTEKPEGINPLKALMEKEIRTSYPEASVTFSPPVTIFEKLFVTGDPDVVARLQVADRTSAPQASDLKELENRIAEATGQVPERTAFRSQLNLVVDRDRLLVYHVNYNEVVRVLRTAFRDNTVSTLRSYQQYLPIGMAGKEKSVNRVLAETLVEGKHSANPVL